MTLHLDIELPNDQNISPELRLQLQAQLRELAVLRLYEQDVLSRSEACTALGIGLRPFLKLLRLYDIAEQRNEDDFEDEIAFATA